MKAFYNCMKITSGGKVAWTMECLLGAVNMGMLRHSLYIGHERQLQCAHCSRLLIDLVLETTRC